MVVSEKFPKANFDKEGHSWKLGSGPRRRFGSWPILDPKRNAILVQNLTFILLTCLGLKKQKHLLLPMFGLNLLFCMYTMPNISLWGTLKLQDAKKQNENSIGGREKMAKVQEDLGRRMVGNLGTNPHIKCGVSFLACPPFSGHVRPRQATKIGRHLRSGFFPFLQPFCVWPSKENPQNRRKQQKFGVEKLLRNGSPSHFSQFREILADFRSSVADF